MLTDSKSLLFCFGASVFSSDYPYFLCTSIVRASHALLCLASPQATRPSPIVLSKATVPGWLGGFVGPKIIMLNAKYSSENDLTA